MTNKPSSSAAAVSYADLDTSDNKGLVKGGVVAKGPATSTRHTEAAARILAATQDYFNHHFFLDLAVRRRAGTYSLERKQQDGLDGEVIFDGAAGGPNEGAG